jgi:hypothetical protein
MIDTPNADVIDRQDDYRSQAPTSNEQAGMQGYSRGESILMRYRWTELVGNVRNLIQGWLAASPILRRPSRILEMLIHGFARGAFLRIVGALQSSYFAALLIDAVVILKRISFGGAIGNTE